MYYIYGIYWVYDIQLEFSGSQFLVLSHRWSHPGASRRCARLGGAAGAGKLPV
jgi:hypothetical protein